MSLPPVVGIVGHLRSGKDEVARVLVEEFGYVRGGFADALKEEVRITLPRTLAELSKVYRLYDTDKIEQLLVTKPPVIRALLQEWGTDLRRAEQPDYWVRRWEQRLQDVERVVTPDCRFENEAAAIRRRGGVLWRVVRPILSGSEANASQHLSETEQEHIHVDAVLTNSGTLEELRRKVRFLLEEAGVDTGEEHDPVGRTLEAH